MKLYQIKRMFMGLAFSLSMAACEDYLEVDAPEHRILGELVFSNDVTAISAMNGIYNQMFLADFSAGYDNSVTVLGALSADDLQYIRETDQALIQFDQNKIFPDNSRNHALWSSAYSIIYNTNALLKGLKESDQISEQVYSSLEGEAKFVRAFTYFYLVNLFGEVPLILTTDYLENSLAAQSPVTVIYDQILKDLSDASELLGVNYRDGDRTRANKFAALALLARVHLYLEDWDEAERIANLVLNDSDQYELKENPDETFLANSKEAIWQISPVGNRSTYTNEGMMFLFHPLAPGWTTVSLAPDFIDRFHPDDKRLEKWVGFNDNVGLFHAHKYKYQSSTETIHEYSMVLRLAEQYFIRSEARARKGELSGALADLDSIRKRAGLELLSLTSPGIKRNQILDSIMAERNRELFTEWGHRWLDLKRTGRTASVLGTENLLFPIPEEERRKNPNLKQNTGY